MAKLKRIFRYLFRWRRDDSQSVKPQPETRVRCSRDSAPSPVYTLVSKSTASTLDQAEDNIDIQPLEELVARTEPTTHPALRKPDEEAVESTDVDQTSGSDNQKDSHRVPSLTISALTISTQEGAQTPMTEPNETPPVKALIEANASPNPTDDTSTDTHQHVTSEAYLSKSGFGTTDTTTTREGIKQSSAYFVPSVSLQTIAPVMSATSGPLEDYPEFGEFRVEAIREGP